VKLGRLLNRFFLCINNKLLINIINIDNLFNLDFKFDIMKFVWLKEIILILLVNFSHNIICILEFKK
jgi:hypothetical protein